MPDIGNVVTSTIAHDKAYELITNIEHTSIVLYLDRNNVPPVFFVVNNNIVVATILAESTGSYLSNVSKPIAS